MTKDELIEKLGALSERFNRDPDTFGGSDSEYQHATGKSEAYADAEHLVRSYFAAPEERTTA